MKTVIPEARPWIQVNGKRVLDFSSNDYLGLSCHPALQHAAYGALSLYGTGTEGSRLIGGTLDLHITLEELVSEFKKTPRALVYNSGYQANIGVVSALVERGDTIFADRLNHASLVDGAILSRASLKRYHHLDMEHLEDLLKKSESTGAKWIITDTVFSMDGDLAPLETLYDLAEQYDAWLILDEAHATGVFGDKHRSGLWETTGIGHQDRVIQMGTFSKALGSFGGYIAASSTVIETLIQFSRSFIYSSALPPAVLGANLAAIDLVMSSSERTDKLWKNIRWFNSQNLPFKTQSAIVPIPLGEDLLALKASESLYEEGFFAHAIRPPTVPEATSRLRIGLSALHKPEHLQSMVNALLKACPTAISEPGELVFIKD